MSRIALLVGVALVCVCGCGKGKDATQDVKIRNRFRQQGLDWLRAELTFHRSTLEEKPDLTRSWVYANMRMILNDVAFDCVRSQEALANLPEQERREWQKLWQDMIALLRRAAHYEEHDPATAENAPAVPAQPPQELHNENERMNKIGGP